MNLDQPERKLIFEIRDREPETHEFSAWIERTVIGHDVLREERFGAMLKPRPRWMPERLWRYIIRRLVVVTEERVR